MSFILLGFTVKKILYLLDNLKHFSIYEYTWKCLKN